MRGAQYIPIVLPTPPSSHFLSWALLLYLQRSDSFASEFAKYLMKIIREENRILSISQKVFLKVSIDNVFIKITLMAQEVHLIMIEGLLHTKFKSVFPY